MSFFFINNFPFRCCYRPRKRTTKSVKCQFSAANHGLVFDMFTYFFFFPHKITTHPNTQQTHIYSFIHSFILLFFFSLSPPTHTTQSVPQLSNNKAVLQRALVTGISALRSLISHLDGSSVSVASDYPESAYCMQVFRAGSLAKVHKATVQAKWIADKKRALLFFFFVCLFFCVNCKNLNER